MRYRHGLTWVLMRPNRALQWMGGPTSSHGPRLEQPAATELGSVRLLSAKPCALGLRRASIHAPVYRRLVQSHLSRRAAMDADCVFCRVKA
jgi:hypothetical protein